MALAPDTTRTDFDRAYAPGGYAADDLRTIAVRYVQQYKDTAAKAKEQAKQAADARVASQGALYGVLILGAPAAFLAGRRGAKGALAYGTIVTPATSRRV